jgi:hypothetical protein
MILYCYRDYLSFGRKHFDYYGVNLYFAHAGGAPAGQQTLTMYDIVSSFARFLRGTANPAKVENAVRRWIKDDDPIVAFMQNCIDGGLIQSACLRLLKQAGIPYRRQNAQVLFKFLRLEQDIRHAPELPPAAPAKAPAAPLDLYEQIREYFVDQFADEPYFQRFDYERNALSEAECYDMQNPDADKISPGDFVFEINGLSPQRFWYYGHHTKGGWLLWQMFPDFDRSGLARLCSKLT